MNMEPSSAEVSSSTNHDEEQFAEGIERQVRANVSKSVGQLLADSCLPADQYISSRFIVTTHYAR
ncbi:hypothetical protein HW555_011696 [Spodoptera exigua]|uniref:Uncharacterized protein n=1 Tax=Spodoptera exigua TaxID=7107 RepID=A0A835L4C4_SPOEX|nr:hypothetical protein HW555_011696 [Spodoptera exigua]